MEITTSRTRERIENFLSIVLTILIGEIMVEVGFYPANVWEGAVWTGIIFAIKWIIFAVIDRIVSKFIQGFNYVKCFFKGATI